MLNDVPEGKFEGMPSSDEHHNCQAVPDHINDQLGIVVLELIGVTKIISVLDAPPYDKVMLLAEAAKALVLKAVLVPETFIKPSSSIETPFVTKVFALTPVAPLPNTPYPDEPADEP